MGQARAQASGRAGARALRRVVGVWLSDRDRVSVWRLAVGGWWLVVGGWWLAHLLSSVIEFIVYSTMTMSVWLPLTCGQQPALY